MMHLNFSKVNNILRIIVFVFLILVFTAHLGYSAQNAFSIKIFSKALRDKINSNVYGTSILGWGVNKPRNPNTYNIKAADYCYGLWDGKWQEYVQEPLVLIKNIKIGSIRLIGQFSEWEKGVKEFGKKEYSFGLNEQLKFCQDIGSEPIICLQNLELTDSYINLFEYLKKRYHNIKYVEIGNESYDILSAEDYANRYLFYYEMIKNINSDIKIGFVGRDIMWESRILAIIGSRFDFIVEHYYPRGGRNNNPHQDSNKLFADLFPKVTVIEKRIQNTLNLMEATIGKRKPIAVTEYNAWFVQEQPVPYRHCLGTALINAELLRIFMKPENNILTANNWNLINEYWGMIANGFNGDYHTINFSYYKRPNYLLFEIYSHHFGEYLTNVEIMFIPETSIINELKGLWTTCKFDGVNVKIDGDNVSLNFMKPSKYNYYHTYKTADVNSGAEYMMSGYLKAENLQDLSGICLEIQDGRGWTKTKSAISSEKISGTTGWIYVETYYKTLPDAKSVKVIIRRIGETGPLKGKAFVKDVKLERISRENAIKADDLSVSSSVNENGDKIYLMIINKNINNFITSAIELNNFSPDSQGDAWVLSGPSVDATNEKDHDNVKITHRQFDVAGSTFEYTFEPHSLTAIEIRRYSDKEYGYNKLD
ncbi:hypothetical protein KAR91_87610 [Candidatus Pacearchaeota archaeon]|nr:hypothetical protein [Candidatus Pacearchaeota archaeon]